MTTHSSLEQLVDEARQLQSIPKKEIAAYKHHLPVLTAYVDATLTRNEKISTLIGHQPLQMMYDNHSHHGIFMLTVFSISGFELLARTIPWVYRSYRAHGFSYDYFPLELSTWKEAMAGHMKSSEFKHLDAVYDWMISCHDRNIVLSQTDLIGIPPVDQSFLEAKMEFQAALFNANHQKCLAIAKTLVKEQGDIERFYMHVIQPVMYDVGMLWEKSEISVAQEHLASAIVGRVMASVSLLVLPPESLKGKAVITASPNEFHEIGAWMVSDVLEHDGWEVKYLGANMPDGDLIDLLLSYQPDILAISVTLAFNLERVLALILRIRKYSELSSLKVMVGGQIFRDNPELVSKIHADAYASSAQDAKKVAESLLSE